MEETLEAGLAKLFGTTRDQAKPTEQKPDVTTPTDVSVSQENLLIQASDTYEAAIRAQRDGDWTRYGEEIKKLGEILNKLR